MNKVDIACITFAATVLVCNHPINKMVKAASESRNLRRLKRDYPQTYAALKRHGLI